VYMLVGEQLLNSSFTNILPNPSSAAVQPSADISNVFANAVFQPINPLAASQALATKSTASSTKVGKSAQECGVLRLCCEIGIWPVITRWYFDTQASMCVPLHAAVSNSHI